MKFKFELLTVLLFLALAGCSNALDRPLHFELPNNYIGPFVLVEERNAPKEVHRQTEEYRIVVPASGVLHLSDAWVFRRWHKTRTSYSDGRSIPVGPSSGSKFHEGPALVRDNNGASYIWFFIGTPADAQKFFNEPDSSARLSEWLKQHHVE